MMMDSVTSSTASMVQTMKGMGETTRTDKAVSDLKAAVTSKDLKRAEQAAEDFEAVFIGEMLKPMFSMIEVNENFGGGKGEEIFSRYDGARIRQDDFQTRRYWYRQSD